MKILCASLLLATAATANAATLYSQPVLDGGGNSYASQNDTVGSNGHFATVFDDFTLGSAATITSVGFVGSYFNGSPATITAFTLMISSDAGGIPGAALYSTTVAGNAGESLVGNVSSYTLPVTFAASAGTKYWLSIYPDLGFPPQWGWSTGTGGDNSGYQVFFGNGSTLPTDFAFTLNGAVPEPATWALMIGGFGLAGVALRRRRLQPA